MRQDSLGDNIKLVRMLKGMLQTEVADICKISAPLLSMFETGVRTPTEEQVVKIAKALGVRPEGFKAIPKGLYEMLEKYNMS